jgi:hypothetical protein
MAIALLSDKYWNGEIERKYRHELEAFIWVLPFVFLRYQDRQSQRGTPVDGWMTDNYRTCAKEKSYLRTPEMLPDMQKSCQSDFKDHWEFAESLLCWLIDLDQSAQKKKKIPRQDE